MNILITGGASGLGASITEVLVKESDTELYFTYSSSIDSAKKIEKKYSCAHAIKCDFTNQEEVSELQQLFESKNISVLVNNASIGFEKNHFHKLSSEYFVQSFIDNILPVVKITQSAISYFRKKKFGKIITILSSSIIGRPPIGWSEYVARKAYLFSLSKSWAVENASFNITANCVSPAFMKTELHKQLDERILDEIEKSHPLKKLLSTEETAETIHFLIHSSHQINGTNLIINAAENVI